MSERCILAAGLAVAKAAPTKPAAAKAAAPKAKAAQPDADAPDAAAAIKITRAKPAYLFFCEERRPQLKGGCRGVGFCGGVVPAQGLLTRVLQLTKALLPPLLPAHRDRPRADLWRGGGQAGRRVEGAVRGGQGALQREWLPQPRLPVLLAGLCTSAVKPALPGLCCALN